MVAPEHKTHELSALPIRILGLFYFWILFFRMRVRRFFERGSLIILAVYLLILLCEVALEWLGKDWAFHPHWLVRAAFFLVIGLALYSKVKEWSEHRQEFYFIQAAKKVVEVFSREWKDGERDEAVNGLLTIFVKNFEQKGAVNANLALPRDGDGKLVVSNIHPASARYDAELALEPGEGGSGYCFVKGCVVYIPWTTLRHAVIQTIAESRPYKLVEDQYTPDRIENFRSILSVPVASGTRRFGVLNFDSRKRNAFRIIDFEQAVFFGFALAQLLQDFEKRSPIQKG